MYADKEGRRRYQREWHAKRRREFFADKVCVSCGGTERLELDHIDPATKVANNIWSWSWARRDVELAKCQVLCHSCHVAKTAARREYAKGEAINTAKLTAEKVAAIRASTGKTNRQLAAEYGVSYSNIGSIRRRETWV